MILRIYSILMICLMPYFLMASPEPQNGTLIVTYTIKEQDERIGRIRFWLRNEQNKQTLYPKGTAFVEDKEKNSRKVVIEDLNSGMYTLEFLIPNLDGSFEEVPVREVMVADGEVVKIDEEIRLRNQPLALLTVSQPLEMEESLSNPHQEPLIDAIEPPFAKKEENKQTEPPPSSGKLIVSYECSENDQLTDRILFRLVNSDGSHLDYPRQGKDVVVPLRSGKMAMIQHVPSGLYQLEFYLKDVKEPLASFPVRIEENRTKSIHHAFSCPSASDQKPLLPKMQKKDENHPLASLTLSANIPTAEYQLINQETNEIFEKAGREATFKDLTPGTYEAHFFSYDPFFIPPKKEIILLSPGAEINQEVSYITLGKVKLSINIPATTVSITPMHSGQSVIKKEIDHGEATFYFPEGKYRMTFRNESGYNAPKPVDFDVKSLQTSQIDAIYRKN